MSDTSEIVRKLRLIQNLKMGEMLPAEFSECDGNWGVAISRLTGEAADIIDNLSRERNRIAETLQESIEMNKRLLDRLNRISDALD